MFYQIERDGKPPVPQVNSGTHVDERYNVPRSLPPGLGANNEAVLREVAELSEAEIMALREDGIL